MKENNPQKALNKAFLKVKPNRSKIESFKTNLITLLDRINDTESEEFHKNLVSDFLKKTYYDPNHFINTKGRNDLVIHNGQNANSTVGVIIEAKKPTNKTEMISTKKLNAKALQELVLYYLRERITFKNLEVKHLVATNINEWFLFDEHLFERLFAQNKSLVRQFENFEASKKTTDVFYKEIAEPFIDNITSEIEYTYFNIQDFQKTLRNTNKEDDNSLIALFKVLSPEHLLKLPFTNDSNSLDKRFYSELLHIIGLTETKEGSKKLIERNKTGERHTGTILEDAIIQLDSLDKLSRLEKPSQFGNTQQERLFNVALELSITWINRILFLKLLEAQLITYNKGDKSCSFLNLDKIKSYDDLNSLFFQVLARKYNERNEDVKKAFEKVPYLNSSLFEPTDLEQVTLFISNLKDDKTIPIFLQTVLKDQQGKKRTGTISTLQYLFEFLDAYDFGAEGGEEIQEDNKTLINASVLGLIFEKINGYKDGSFFTPGFITMYMCRETIRKAVIQKFNEAATPLLRGVGGVSTIKTGVSSSQNTRQPRREVIPYNPALKELARELRNKSTKSEIILWKQLKGKFEGKYDFHRQKPLDNFIADFFCHECKLVIEIDGATHNWEETQQNDLKKEFRLNELGLNVLRFPDSDIFKNLDSTLATIQQYIEGFEKGDLSALIYEDSPLNPLTGNEGIITDTHSNITDTPLGPLSRGDKNAGKFTSLDDVYEQIGDGRLFTRQQANDIINSIKICDPAVGSGHFLVSALNEMIAIKNDLKILQDRNGKRLKEYHVEVVNDELIVTDEEGELFEYTPPSPHERGTRGVSESQRVQETLFHEKQTIIENCLFGVDINPNSVKICRLRLWIELLKNAYYIVPGHAQSPKELETLPNIDINIKCGNSLVSRFAIDADLKQALKKSKWSINSYRLAVATYRNAKNKEQKREMEKLIADIKSDFRTEISNNDPKVKKLFKLQGELFQLVNQTTMFDMSKKEKAEWNKKVEALTQETKKLEAEIEEIKANKIFENAFEWRFEFPEVLNNNGDFVGFDVVIGNPPYISMSKIKDQTSYFENAGYLTYSKSTDIYCLFYEKGVHLLKPKGTLTYITSNSWLRTQYGQLLRKFLVEKTNPLQLINIEDIQVFEDATVESNIIEIEKSEWNSQLKAISLKSDFNLSKSLESYFIENNRIISSLNESGWTTGNQAEGALKNKIESKGTILKELGCQILRGFTTGFNEAFFMTTEKRNQLVAEDSSNADIIKPALRGKDISKFNYVWKDIWVLLIKQGMTNEQNKSGIDPEKFFSNSFPLIYRHLKEIGDSIKGKGKGLYARDDQGDFWWELRPCVYYDEFEKPKIVWGELSDSQKFAYDDSGMYANNTIFFITGNNLKYLLSILNSKVAKWYFNEISTSSGMGTNRWLKYKIELLPIFQPSMEQMDSIEKIADKIISLKKQNSSADTTDLENQIDQLVYKLYDLTEEEIKIVEGN
jgi:very-short-patch-repair endonuclease/type II restriction/modification system DNA methylase subunit YeeA